jgi:hypothetical protein
MTAWQLVLGCVTAVASITAATLSWRAGRSAIDQRENQARREEWSHRYQWAIELVLSDDEHRVNIGIVLLREAMHGPLASEAELRAARSALESWLSMTIDRELEPPYTDPSNEEETDNE